MGQLPRSLIALACLALAATVACKKEEEPEHPLASARWVEDVALDNFASRQTLYGLGDPVSKLYDLPRVITSRDPSILMGPEAAPRLLITYRPMAAQHLALVFHGAAKMMDVELSGRNKVLFSTRGEAMAVYEGLDPPLGEAWLPDTEVKVHRAGSAEPVTIPKEQGLELGPLLDDGTLFIRDAPGVFRRYGPDGARMADLKLPGIHPSKAPPGEPRSKMRWLPAQHLVAVYDYEAPADRQGRRGSSGIRLFHMDSGALVATYPQGVEVIGGSTSPDRYLVLEKPGKLALIEGGKRAREGFLPGRGELAVSPNGQWVSITSEDNRLWLFDTGPMAGVWEHTSPEPWNRFFQDGSIICDNGRIYAARRQEGADSALIQMQLFTLDAEGKGKVLLERPYRDANVPPVWIVGTTDEGRRVMFGALGEELRIVDIP